MIQFVFLTKFQVISRFCPGPKVIIQVIVQTIFAPKGIYTKGILNLQQSKTWKKLSQYNIEIWYILTFQVLSKLFCPGFLTFWDKFQPISGNGQIKFKSPGFPGF